MARIMRDIYWPSAMDQQSTPHVLGLTASIIAGKLLEKEKKREELEVLLQSSVFSPDISTPSSGGVEQEVTYHKVDYPQESMQGYEVLVERKVEQLAATFDGITRVEFEKATKHAQHVLSECGMSGFIYYFGESLVYQLERHARNLKVMADNAQANAKPRFAAKAEELSVKLPQLRQMYKQAAAQLQEDGELTAVPLVSGKCSTLLQLLTRLFEAHQDDAEYKGIIFVQQECKALSPSPFYHLQLCSLSLCRWLSARLLQTSSTSTLPPQDAQCSPLRSLALAQCHSSGSTLDWKTSSVANSSFSCAQPPSSRASTCSRASLWCATPSSIPPSRTCSVLGARVRTRPRYADSTSSTLPCSVTHRPWCCVAQVYYFENDPTQEKAQATALRQCARDDNLRLSRAEQQAGVVVHTTSRAASD